MIQSSGLSYAYADEDPLFFPDVNCGQKEHWLILGESGCGKTTLLHLFAGLISPKEGRITINGTDLASLSQSKMDRFRGDHVGIIFQRPHFVRAISVAENLQLAQNLAGFKTDKTRVDALLTRLRIDHRADKKPSALSQGELQRAAIARALVNKPLVILADEPTSALDDTNCHEVIQLFQQEAEHAGATLIIVTHDGRLKQEFDKTIELKK